MWKSTHSSELKLLWLKGTKGISVTSKIPPVPHGIPGIAGGFYRQTSFLPAHPKKKKKGLKDKNLGRTAALWVWGIFQSERSFLHCPGHVPAVRTSHKAVLWQGDYNSVLLFVNTWMSGCYCALENVWCTSSTQTFNYHCALGYFLMKPAAARVL